MQLLKRASSLIIKRASSIRFLCKTNLLTKQSCSYSIIKTSRSSVLNRYYHEELYYSNIEEREDVAEDLFQTQALSVRHILYPQTSDELMNLLNNSASVQDVFDFIKQYENKMDSSHIAQSVLILWDIQKMFYQFNIMNNNHIDTIAQDYINRLVESDEFNQILKLIDKNIDSFNIEALTCLFLYLNKIGLNLKHCIAQKLINKIQIQFKNNNCSLTALSRFIVTIFYEHNLSSFLIVQDIVPKVISYLDHLHTSEDIKLLTICLNNINQLITKDILDKYRLIIRKNIDNNILNKNEYRTLLKIILFLNYPHWRDKNTSLISECMLLLKNNLHTLNVFELLIFYEVFYKIQEPADLLNEIQRHASKFLHELEEDDTNEMCIRLKLLSCIVCFSTLGHRPQFENIIHKYLEYDLNGYALLELHNILIFTKKSDQKSCKLYWDKLLKVMEHDETFLNENLLKICYNYMNFNQDLDNFRHLRFEKRIKQWLEGLMETGITSLIPSRFSTIAAFILAFGNDPKQINDVINKLDDIWEQLNHVDCVNLAKCLQICRDGTKNPLITTTHLNTINTILDNCLNKEIGYGLDANKINLLIKSCIYRNKFDQSVITKLVKSYNDVECISSKTIKNVTFCLHSTNTLIPKIIDNMANYIYRYKNNVLGFNVEKVVYLCYYLGYKPNTSIDFFKVVSDIILRDQERLSGLSYLQTCLSLSFFHELPDSFIKQIFNIEFLEKLDYELLHCYSKDVYPIRVRSNMMQLNRAVCMDYPESNVPWFHKKYVDINTKKTKEENKEYLFHFKVYDYLLKYFKNTKYMLENVIAPYGYHIDFVIHLNTNNEITNPNADEHTQKIAILLMRPKVYTKQTTQLKGACQLKIRHLEMFGYNVILIDFKDWKKLVYGEEKMNYISNLFNNSIENYVINR